MTTTKDDSAGAGDVTRYLGRYGTKRVAKVVLASSIPPIVLNTAANPGGLPISVFDDTRRGVATKRSQFYKDASTSVFGANRPGASVPQGVRDAFWLQSMQCGLRGAHACIKASSETYFTEDPKKIDVPTLLLHGEDDKHVPMRNHASLSATLLKRPTIKIYPGAPHGLPMVLAAQSNARRRELPPSLTELPEKRS